MKAILTIAALTFLMHGGMTAAYAAEQIPDFKSCPKLADEETYEDDYSSVKMMMQGKEGFAFRTRQDLYSDFTVDNTSLALFKALSGALKEKGTTLIIALLPTRGIAAANFLPDDDPLMGDYNAKKTKADYAALIAKMNANGVQTVGDEDIKAKEKYFYKADHHWTTSGAQEMAAILAKKIKKDPLYKTIKKTEFKTTPLEEVSFSGTFNETLKPLCGFQMPMEHDVLTKTEPVKKGVSEDDLFGAESDPEIVLVGTSNSKKNSNNLNFDGYLKELLSADIYNGAVTGGGLDDALIGYLTSGQFRAKPAKILIWEIPGYYSFSGEDMRKVLQQAIAAAYGDCRNPIATAKKDVNAESIKLIEGLEGQNINPTDTYLQIRLSAPAEKNFSVIFQRADGKSQMITFKPSKRVDNDGAFFFTPQNESKAPLAAIEMKAPPKLYGLSAEAMLCPLPAKIIPVKEEEKPLQR